MSKAQVFAATTNQIKKPLITTIPYPSTFHPTYQNSPPLKLSMKSPDRNPSHWLSEHQGSDMAQSPRNGVKEGRKEGGKEAQILFHHQPNINNDITHQTPNRHRTYTQAETSHRHCEVFIKLNDSAKRAHEETPP
jgi:hypothetical protein